MFNTGKLRHRYQIVSTYPNYTTCPLPAGPDAQMGIPSRHTLQRENPDEKCQQRNGFFEGLLYLLPLAILFWIGIIWGLCNFLH